MHFIETIIAIYTAMLHLIFHYPLEAAFIAGALFMFDRYMKTHS